MARRSSRSPSQLRRDEDRVSRKNLKDNLALLVDLETDQLEKAGIEFNDLLDLLENLHLSMEEEYLIEELMGRLA